uniref:Globin domain-containing protein n=1 Tax=Anopheles atroparvus TaxID=41427 RepID=A0A182IYR6_ANOAO
MSGPTSLVAAEEEEQTNYHTPDETGLTKSQKVALIAAWSIVKKDLVTHGRNIFVIFFEEYPQYLDYFDFSASDATGDLGENRSLHAHALNVMNFIGTLIDYGLNDPDLLKCSLARLVRNHRRRNVTKEDVGAVGGVIMRYCLKALEQHRSKTLEDAFGAFLGTVAAAFE